MNQPLPFLSAEELTELLPYADLIAALRRAFRTKGQVPPRPHYTYENPALQMTGTLLLMPAWQDQYLGVKMATVSPKNGAFQLPAVQGIYTLFETKTGQPIASLEAKTLTNLRTAATSALAADYLATSQAKTLLMVGTGALAPALIRAHATVRPIRRVFVWGRNFSNAKKVAAQFSNALFSVTAVSDLTTYLPEADIISCATLSPTALILGRELRAGQHLDLVGSYQPHTREADDECIRRAEVYVDTREGALRESGDLAIPLRTGVLSEADIRGDLFQLCNGTASGRRASEAITLFKSVGYALEDLAAAILAYERWRHEAF